jgi:2,3-bisphosphoglycerate-independent phosphoglycerate mutase
MRPQKTQTSGVLLMILDGWGIAEDVTVSAIDAAATPFYDFCKLNYPNASLRASEQAVGLPAGQMGNSEVGHMNLGAGRIVYQELERITNSIQSGAIAQNKAFKSLVEYCKLCHPMHLMGLVSDGGVHSHIDHLKGLISWASEAGLKEIFIHVFTDGRDTDPHAGLRYVQDLEQHLAKTGVGKIASVIGRYYAMDRDKRWERTKEAYNLLVNGKGTPFSTATQAIQGAYTTAKTDEFLEPSVMVDESGLPVATLTAGDAILFFNFRTDRGRQLTEALTQRAIPEFGMSPVPLHFSTLSRYDDTYRGVHVLFEKENLRHTLGEQLAAAGKKQVRIAETEKYPHVTFFFNGGREAPFPGEERILCPSPKVSTYDLAPEMSAMAIRDSIIPQLAKQEADFICLNFANPDMVGHTGIFEAAVKACKVVDSCAKSVTEAAHEAGYHVIIIADHGNADKMRNPDGSPNTAHTLALVPFIFISADTAPYEIKAGKLGDIAPTILSLLGLPIPDEMTGDVLLERIHANA